MTARAMYEEACQHSTLDDQGGEDFCTMCGREWCSVRINKELRDSVSSK
ncbi:MAG: hypothetical protein ACYS8O_00990 [Planctomycetota bacterium]